MITWLDDAADAARPEPFAGADHPMRKITRAVADGEGWSAERAGKIADLFDSMAEGWSAEHVNAGRTAPVVDAIERGGVSLAADWIELGSGTGAGAVVLVPRLKQDGGSLVCTDLSMEMLRHAPPIATRVRADSSLLPFADASFDVALMINMILFPAEVVRILRPGGTVVWINTLGDQTPIHLPPEDVAEALGRASGSTWSGVAAHAGTGLWSTLRTEN